MKLRMEDGAWNPYLAGALVGVLAILSAIATTKLLGKTNFLGTSTTFVRAAGYVEKSFAPERVAKNEYFTREKVRIDWQFMFVLGIFLGSLISALQDKSFKFESVPPRWSERFGNSVWKRAVAAFLGGIIAILGARMADGCPSGHGLSGMMQLSASAFIALAFFYIAGVITAHFLYLKKEEKT